MVQAVKQQARRPSAVHKADTDTLRRKVSALERDVKALRLQQSSDVVVLRTITRTKAREEILGLFRSGQTLYYSDVARRLRIDLPLVVDICNELLREGKIDVHQQAHAHNGL